MRGQDLALVIPTPCAASTVARGTRARPVTVLATIGSENRQRHDGRRGANAAT